MNIISKTALSNFKKNKSRNILIGVAIALTSLLLTVAPTVIVGYINVQDQAVRKIFPTFHAMFRDIDDKTAREIMNDERIEEAGIQEDVAVMDCDDWNVNISMLSVDQAAARLTRQELSEGRLPKEADEIVVSDGIQKAMGLTGTIGDRIEIPFRTMGKSGEDGEGFRESREFTIVGMVKDNETSIREGSYVAFVSDAFAGEILPGEHKYRLYLRIKDVEGVVTDHIKEQIRSLGQEYEVEVADILVNGEYLSAAYVDTATYKGLAVVMLVVSIVGVLTIYSIYYVSMLDKVQEYGRLRAIGATKRQIRKLVFREGFTVAAIAIPIGIILGLLVGMLVIREASDFAADSGNMISVQLKYVLDHREVRLVQPWIIACSILVSLATVYVSLLRPMRTASRIPTVEAIRYQGENESKKKSRKGYGEMNTRKLTITNLKRNKRRTAITICALGATGCLFIIVATVCSCMDPDSMTRREIRRDIQVSVDSYGDDEMYPERSLRNIQQNNPLTEELKKQIIQIDGVEDIDVERSVTAGLLVIEENDGRPFQTGITGISDTAWKELRAYVTDGSLDDPALFNGTGIVVGEVFRDHFLKDLGWEVGTKIQVQVADGKKDMLREFKIAALVDGPSSLGGTYLSMPSDTLQSICKTDLSDVFEITVEDGKEDAAAEEIRALVEYQEFLQVKTYKEVYQQEEQSVSLIMYGCYGLLLVFGLIGILNFVNTMINSVYVRRKELGMLQAIGMSGRQTVRMLQMEGLFYTAGTLVISLGIGSLAGYDVFRYMKENGIFSITVYQYPKIPAVVLAAVLLTVQILITYLVNQNFRKQSLTDRIRFAE